MAKRFYVYILSSRSRRLYIGVTNDIVRRVDEHRRATSIRSFTRRYIITSLVYVECTTDVRTAIAREKQLKGWTRRRKIALIESANPSWTDLAGALTP
jgi:putative endonuclease